MTGEDTTGERGVGDKGDVQLLARLHDADLGILDIEGEWRVFDLVGGDGMDRVGTAEGSGGSLRDTQVLDLASPRENQK